MKKALGLIAISTVISSCAVPVFIPKSPVRKIAAVNRSCAEVAKRQALSGYPISDQAMVKALRNTSVYQSTCVGSQGERLTGRQFPPIISKGAYLTWYNCDQNPVTDLAAQISFKKEFGSSFTEIDKKINWKHNPAVDAGATTQQWALIQAELKPFQERLRSISNGLSEHKAKSVVADFAAEICFQETEDEIISGTALKDCTLPQLPDPKYLSAPLGPTQTTAKASKGVGIMLKLDGILRANKECELKSEEIKTLFATATVSNLDDLVVITYLTRNLEHVLQNPALIGVLASAMNGAEIQSPFCNSRVEDCNGMVGTMHIVRNSLIKAELEALKIEGAAGYDFFDKLPSEGKARVVGHTVGMLDTILKNPLEANAYSEALRDDCDGILSDLFGDGVGLVSGSGYGLFRDTAYMKDGRVCEKGDYRGCVKKTLDTASYSLGTGHSYVLMHIYADKNVADELGRPTYAPDNWTSTGKGGGWASKGSFLLNYKRFGRYRNVIYNPNHLADYQMLGNKSNERNKSNWVRIGSIGGKGGGGAADRALGMVDYDSPYVHSHLQILQGANGKVMLNFQDAFCRGKPAP